MTLTPSQFRDVHPEFSNTPEAIIQWNLDHAYLRTPANVWGCYRDMGAALLAADLIARSPMSRDMRLVGPDGDTIYGNQRKDMVRLVAAGPRVAGLPSGLKAELDAAVPSSCDVEDDPTIVGDVILVQGLSDLPAADADGLIHLQGADSALYLVDGHINLEGASLAAPSGGVGLVMTGRRGFRFDGFYSDVDPAVKPAQVAVLQGEGDQMNPNPKDGTLLQGLNFWNSSTVADTLGISVVAYPWNAFRDVSFLQVDGDQAMAPAAGGAGPRNGVLVQCSALTWYGGEAECAEAVVRGAAYTQPVDVSGVWANDPGTGAEGACFFEMDSAHDGTGIRFADCLIGAANADTSFLRILDGATIFASDSPYTFHGCTVTAYSGVHNFYKVGAGYLSPYDYPGHFWIRDCVGTPDTDGANGATPLVDAGFYDAATPYALPITVAGQREVLAPTLDVGLEEGWSHAAGVWTYDGSASIQFRVGVVVVMEPASGSTTNLSAGIYYDGVLEAHDQALIKSSNKATGTAVIGSIHTIAPGGTVEARVSNEGGTVDIDVWSVHWTISPI